MGYHCTMKKTYAVHFCLEDFKSGKQAIEVVFDLIEKVKAAVFAQSGKVVSYSYSNVPDRDMNIDGNVGTISFEVITHDEYARELVVEHWLDPRGTNGLAASVYTMVSFRSANTTAPWSSLNPGVGGSQAVHV